MPKWGQEVIGDEHLIVSSGQAGYLAFALRGLNIPTKLISSIGGDHFGNMILSDLQAVGVDSEGVEICQDLATGISVAVARPDGERAFVTSLGSMSAFSLEMALRNWEYTLDSEIVCLVGIFMLSKLGLGGAKNLLHRARSEGKVTLLDTGWDPANWPESSRNGIWEMLSEVTIFLPNIDEAFAITNRKSVEEAAQDLLSMGPKLIAIKCGQNGSYGTDGEQSYWVGVRPVEVFDVVGAGDNFNAGFLWGLRSGWPLKACLAFGNTTASLYVSKKNNRFPQLEFALSAAHTSYQFIP